MEFTKSKLQLSWSRLGATALLALTLLGGALSFAGTKDGGGGGNVRPSTRADIQALIDQRNWIVLLVSDDYSIGAMSQAPLKPELRKITQKILYKDYFAFDSNITDILLHVPIEVSDGPCFEDGEAKDASTQIGGYGTRTICLSASQLSRFPKGSLIDAVIPLLFHEIAHQYGFGEPEAKAFQSLAEIHLQYWPAYLASIQALTECSAASQSLTPAETISMLAFFNQTFKEPHAWPTIKDSDRKQIAMACAAHSMKVANTLERLLRVSEVRDWDPQWKLLTKADVQMLAQYDSVKYPSFNGIMSLIGVLRNAPLSASMNCEVCTAQKIDPEYVMMVANKGTVEFVGRQVELLERDIQVGGR